MSDLETRKDLDFDNSLHAPFSNPTIKEMECLNYRILLSGLDCSQNHGLADRYFLKFRRIGRHYGRNKLMKVAGRSIEHCN
jgi:hypothetical protein